MTSINDQCNGTKALNLKGAGPITGKRGAVRNNTGQPVDHSGPDLGVGPGTSATADRNSAACPPNSQSNEDVGSGDAAGGEMQREALRSEGKSGAALPAADDLQLQSDETLTERAYRIERRHIRELTKKLEQAKAAERASKYELLRYYGFDRLAPDFWKSRIPFYQQNARLPGAGSATVSDGWRDAVKTAIALSDRLPAEKLAQRDDTDARSSQAAAALRSEAEPSSSLVSIKNNRYTCRPRGRGRY